MDALITFAKKNPATALLVAVLLPMGLTLLYSSGRGMWLRRRNKKESAAIHAFLIQSGAEDKAITNEQISRATGIPKNRVIGLCAEHEDIEDAGKRQRSWKLKGSEADEDEE